MSTINTGLHYPLDLTQLPTGWHADYVGAFAAEIQSGFACGRHSSEDIGVPHLRPMNVTREGRVDLSEIKYVPLDHDDRRLQENDVLFNNTNSPQLIGKTAFVDARAAGLAFSNHMTRVRFASKVDPKFAAFQLHYLWMAGYYLHKCVKHVNQASISSRDFARMIPFVAPPLNEQHRIVAQIEALLSALDKGIEKLNAARFQLRAYRAAVLDNGLHSGGHDVDHRPLGELIGSIQQGWSPKCDPNRTPDDGEWGVIKTTTIQPMQYLPNQCKPLPPELDPRSNIEIHERDLLMTRKGPRHRTGVVCLVRGVRKRSMLCDTVYRFRADESKVSPEYLEIALNAPSVVAALDKKKSGISESGITLNHGKIKSVQIPVAQREAQEAIVSLVRSRFSHSEKLHEEIETQLARVNVLRQCILKRAFSGKLGTRDMVDGSDHLDSRGSNDRRSMAARR